MNHRETIVMVTDISLILGLNSTGSVDALLDFRLAYQVATGLLAGDDKAASLAVHLDLGFATMQGPLSVKQIHPTRPTHPVLKILQP